MHLAFARRPAPVPASPSIPAFRFGAPGASPPLRVGAHDAPEERAAERAADAVLRRAPSAGGGAAAGGIVAPPIVHAVLSAPGEALEAGARGEMEGRFGHDFGRVRVHRDAGAGASAAAVGARAYAAGPHLVFAPGEYAPARPEGRRLLAHELAHVVQHEAGAAPVLRRQTPAAPPAGKQVTAPAPVAPPADPSWSEAEIKEVQRKLAALGLYPYTVDGGLGNETKAALVEAFGDESWRTLSGADAAKKLAAATKPAGKAGEHRFRFGEMFKDGVLDVSLAVGFDEKGQHNQAAADVEAVLTARGFAEDAQVAATLYTQAGRSVPASSFGKFFVKKDALTYTPPAGTARKIHAVVRLLFSSSGAQGGSVAAGYQQGMSQSDVAYYTGHGRYGTGPDFDAHTIVEFLNPANGQVLRRVENYETLEELMTLHGKKNARDPWSEFLWWVKEGRIRVVPSTAGNVRMTPAKPSDSRFGRKLMDWNLNRDGRDPVTGSGNALEQAAQAKEARKYRVLVFDGCKTTSYVQSIHATKGYDTKSTDILGTKDEIDWGTEGPALASFLDGIINQQSAEEITKNMDAKRGVYGSFGTADNPVVK